MDNITEDRFFFGLFKLRDKISSIEEWMSDYRRQRESYPEWETRNGDKIKVENLTDRHLDNLIKFVKPNTGWDIALAQEHKYRQYRFELQKLEKDLSEAESLADVIY